MPSISFTRFWLFSFFSLTNFQNNFELLHSYFQPVLPPKRQLQQRGHLRPVRCRQKLDPRHERDVPSRRSIFNPAEGAGGEPPTSDPAPRNPDLKRRNLLACFSFGNTPYSCCFSLLKGTDFWCFQTYICIYIWSYIHVIPQDEHSWPKVFPGT